MSIVVEMTKSFRDSEGREMAFVGDNGKLYLLRCPECKRENWSMAVATGRCAWCGKGYKLGKPPFPPAPESKEL